MGFEEYFFCVGEKSRSAVVLNNSSQRVSEETGRVERGRDQRDSSLLDGEQITCRRRSDSKTLDGENSPR